MFKFLNFLVRNPAMTPAQFREHYENSHVPMAFRTFPQIIEHRRNYATEGGAMFPPEVNQAWDAIVEITMENRKGFDDMMAFLGDAEASRELVADGDIFLDSAKCAMLIVDQTVTTR